MKKKKKRKKTWQLHTQLRPMLRKLWLWSPMRREALKKQRLGSLEWEKGKRCEFFSCEKCNRVTPTPEVNHKVPCGSLEADREGFIDRLFCEASGLEVLCKRCHTTFGKNAQAPGSGHASSGSHAVV